MAWEWAVVTVIILALFVWEYKENDCLYHKDCNSVCNELPKGSEELLTFVKNQVYLTNNVSYWRQSVLAGLIGASILHLVLFGKKFDLKKFLMLFIVIFIVVYGSFSWIGYHYYLQNNMKIQENLDILVSQL